MFQWGDGRKLYFLEILETRVQMTMNLTTPDTMMKGKQIMPTSVGSEASISLYCYGPH